MSERSRLLNRRTFASGAGATLVALGAGAGVGAGHSTPAATADRWRVLGQKQLSIGILLYPRIDQIDLTGPFAVLSRLPNSTVQIVSHDGRPVKDHKGLVLTPDATLDGASSLDVLLVPGGPGQEALMDDERMLSLIRSHADSGRIIFSVCTGALVCGAAGVLRGRRATTHWAAFDLLRYFGATPVDARVVVDDNIVSAAGITAGIDGALRLAALLRSEQVAQEIQLDIQYEPEPPFDSGSPQRAPRTVLAAVSKRYEPLTDARRLTAQKVAARLAIGK